MFAILPAMHLYIKFIFIHLKGLESLTLHPHNETYIIICSIVAHAFLL